MDKVGMCIQMSFVLKAFIFWDRDLKGNYYNPIVNDKPIVK